MRSCIPGTEGYVFFTLKDEKVVVVEEEGECGEGCYRQASCKFEK